MDGLQEFQIFRRMNGGNRTHAEIIGGAQIKAKPFDGSGQYFRPFGDFGDWPCFARDHECLAVMAKLIG